VLFLYRKYSAADGKAQNKNVWKNVLAELQHDYAVCVPKKPLKGWFNNLMKTSTYKSISNAYEVEKLDAYDEMKERIESQSKWGTSEIGVSSPTLHLHLSDSTSDSDDEKQPAKQSAKQTPKTPSPPRSASSVKESLVRQTDDAYSKALNAVAFHLPSVAQALYASDLRGGNRRKGENSVVTVPPSPQLPAIGSSVLPSKSAAAGLNAELATREAEKAEKTKKSTPPSASSSSSSASSSNKRKAHDALADAAPPTDASNDPVSP
jgi:hypothetical protein